MSSAPAGWYRDPRTSDVTRYWDGTAWLEPGASPAAETGFSPEPARFEPSGGIEPAAEFRPMPAETHAGASVGAEQPDHRESLERRETLGHRDAAQHHDVTWDVVGTPRQTDTPATNPSARPEWSAATPQGYGSPSYPTAAYPTPAYPTPAYSPDAYASPTPLPYGTARSTLRHTPGWVKIATVIGVVVIGFAVRWAFGLFFGGDFSDDGRIEATAPLYWTTYTESNPDITYAMDANWRDVTDSGAIRLASSGMRLIDARTLSTDFAGEQAIVVLVATDSPLPGAKATRDQFSQGFSALLSQLEASGAEIVSQEDLTVLESAAGDRWGFSSAKVSINGIGVTIYDAAGVIDDYIVEVELVVPDGVALTQADILAVVNSIEAR